MNDDLRQLVTSTLGSDGTFDPELAEAVQCLCEELQLGHELSQSDVANRFPRHQTKLRELLPTLRLLVQVDGHAESTATSGLPAGGMLGGYRLNRVIGRGGMGVVYEAEQPDLSRRVAVKILPAAMLMDDRRLQRFQNEARAAAMLVHPNIVTVHAVGSENEVPFYVMELIDGPSLEQLLYGRLSHCGSMPTERVLDETPSSSGRGDLSEFGDFGDPDHVAVWGIEVANALHYAHSQGVIHRDIKPSNLLLDKHGKVHIADFGLARIETQSELTTTSDFLGTLRYMSPEQVDKKVVDHRSDVYSLGLTLYECIAARPAFASESVVELSHDILETEPTSLRELAPRVSTDLTAIVHKAIEKDPGARYQSAKELADDLQRLVDRKPVIAQPVGNIRRTWKWAKRNRSKATLACLVSTILSSLAIIGPLAAVNQHNRVREQAATVARQRHEAYDADMARAHDHIEQGEIPSAVRILQNHVPDAGEPDYRRFEWYEMLDRCQRRLECQDIDMQWPVWSAAISPQGDLAATAYFSGVQVFGKDLKLKWQHPRINKKVMRDCHYSHDGRVLLTSDWGGLIAVWNAQTGERLASVQLPSYARSLAIRADGLVAMGIGFPEHEHAFPSTIPQPIRLAELDVTEQDGVLSAELRVLDDRLMGAIGAVRSVEFSPEGRLLASSSEDGIVRVWEVATRQLVQTFTGHNGPVTSVAFSPDGSEICSVGGVHAGTWVHGEAFVWNVETAKRRLALHHNPAIYEVAFSQDGRIFTAGLDRRIKVWDAGHGNQIEEINAHSDAIRVLCLSPDALVSGSDDNHVRFWDISTKQGTAMSRASDEGILDLDQIAFSADGGLAVTGSDDGYLRLWDTEAGTFMRRVGKHDNSIGSVAFSPDGGLVACAAAPKLLTSSSLIEPDDPEFCLWDVKTGNQLQSEKSAPTNLAFSSDGTRLVFLRRSTGDKYKIVVWNVVQWKQELESVEPTSAPMMLVDDKVCTPDGTWKYPTLNRLHRLSASKGEFHRWCVNQDATLYAVSRKQKKTIEVRSFADDTLVRTLAGVEEIVLSMRFSPDGTRLASGTQQGTVIVWNVETGNEIIRYRDHRMWVFCVRWSPDGKIFSSSAKGRFAGRSLYFRRAISPAMANTLLTCRTASEGPAANASAQVQQSIDDRGD